MLLLDQVARLLREQRPVGRRIDDDGLQLLTTAYDTEAALETLERAGFPLFRQWLVDSLRGEVSAEEATASFESRRGA